MSLFTPRPYSMTAGEVLHYLTLTVVDWLDVFTRPEFARCILDSLTFCAQHKGLNIHGWVLMTNHLHLLASAEGGKELAPIVRDFKKFTAHTILTLLDEGKVNESRSRAFLHAFGWHGQKNSRNERFQFWQQHNHAVHVFTPAFTEQKLRYIHENPVKMGWVEEPWHYRYSSARDYMTMMPGLVPVCLLE